MTWRKAFAEWIEEGVAYLSVTFTWELPTVYQRAVWLRQQGYDVRAGGPAVALMPDYLRDVAQIGGDVDALPHHNPEATFTSRGCIRHCSFCAVPKIEGELRELREWEARPIVCDNNLLACTRNHFDKVIDRLKPLQGIDFNQGLDARLLTSYHAGRLAEVYLHAVRLAWDSTRLEPHFRQAWTMLHQAGIPAKLIRVLVLIGFDDTPDDALYRLEAVRAMGSWPNPQRYQPLDALRKNCYVAPGWTERLLQDYMRYWSRLQWLAAVPFADYLARRRPIPIEEGLL